MLAFDMKLTKVPQSASEAIQRKTGAALPVYTGVRLLARIDLANDTFAEPAPENVFQEAMAADWDEQSAATTGTTTSPSSRSSRRGDIPVVSVGELSSRAMVLPTVDTCILSRLECELRAAVHWT